MLLSLVIPAYNEEKTLKEIVAKVQNSLNQIDFEIIIVNDYSKDSTLEIIKELTDKFPNIKYISNQENLGKTQSVKFGILATKGDYVCIQDADLEYDPSDLNRLFIYAVKNDLDLVYGNRFGYKNEVVYWANYIGNRFLSFVSSIFTGFRANMWVNDMEVCYKLAKGDIYREIAKTIKSKSTFGLEPELTAKFSKIKGIKFGQLPIQYFPRTAQEGKKMNAIKDGFMALAEIGYFNLLSDKLQKKIDLEFFKYVLIGFTGLTLDFLSFILFVDVLQISEYIANPISMSIGIINNYIFNALINFKIKDGLFRRFLYFYSIGIIGIILSQLFIFLVHDIIFMKIINISFAGFLSIELLITKALSIVFIAIIQYLLHKKFTFKQKNV